MKRKHITIALMLVAYSAMAQQEDEGDITVFPVLFPEKLTEKSGDIGACGVSQFAVRVFAEAAADQPVQGIIDDSGSQKGDRAAQQNKPCAAENADFHISR